MLLGALLALAGCDQRFQDPAGAASRPALRIGFGFAVGQDPARGLPFALANIGFEGLVVLNDDGRPAPALVEEWKVSSDGLRVSLRLRRNVNFHDGTPLAASTVRDVLLRDLPAALGPAYEDIDQIRATSESEVVFVMKQRSALLLEGLDVSIDSARTTSGGTGAFVLVRDADTDAEMTANDSYWGGRPAIERVVFRKYPSLRSAWADLLRGEVDVLYEVGADALASLERSKHVNIIKVHRPYAFVIVLNQRLRSLGDSSLRRELNRAIDRQALLDHVFGGSGAPSEGPVDPRHWAYDDRAPRFHYRPRALDAYGLTFHCIVPDPAYERLALAVQKQLAEVGVKMQLDLMSVDDAFSRVNKGDFEAMLADVVIGPPLVRPYLFWHSRGPHNWGSYSSPAVDPALDQIRHAPDDATYKAGVSAFQRAIVDDPPAIFLVSSQRAMAVSTRFVVPSDPGRDILSTLWRWQPRADRTSKLPTAASPALSEARVQ